MRVEGFRLRINLIGSRYRGGGSGERGSGEAREREDERVVEHVHHRHRLVALLVRRFQVSLRLKDLLGTVPRVKKRRRVVEHVHNRHRLVALLLRWRVEG